MANDAQMPERIWLIPNAGNDGETVWCDDPAPGTGMDPDDAVEYLRADLCASGQVRALEARPWVVFDAVFRFLKDDAKTQEVFDAITSALTPAPQPDGQVMDGWIDDKTFIEPVSPAATPTAQETVPMMTDEEISEFIADYGHPEDTFSYLTPPQSSETVAEALNHALDACRIIDAAVLEGHDNTSDLICHLLEAVEPARAALRILKGEE